MNIKKQTIVGYTAGLIIVVASIARWFVVWNDPSQAVLGAGIGSLVIAFSFVYQRLVEITEDIKDTNRGMDALTIWARDEFEKISK